MSDAIPLETVTGEPLTAATAGVAPETELALGEPLTAATAGVAPETELALGEPATDLSAGDTAAALAAADLAAAPITPVAAPAPAAPAPVSKGKGKGKATAEAASGYPKFLKSATRFPYTDPETNLRFSPTTPVRVDVAPAADSWLEAQLAAGFILEA